ncbi:MAG: hypothetical protein AMJ94_15735 [Deltaproteobacteria bacterium SM23_61]|nr:MAG: hypothetical protein AMJ94_15735 [Deltaproteobacteria bacterium SM23_61]
MVNHKNFFCGEVGFLFEAHVSRSRCALRMTNRKFMESGYPAAACCVPLGAGAFLPGPWQAFMKDPVAEFGDDPFFY